MFKRLPQGLEGWIGKRLQQVEPTTEDAKREIKEGLEPAQVFSDNQGALVTVKSGVLKPRFNHVDIKYHRSRGLQTHRIVNFESTHQTSTSPCAYKGSLRDERT